MSSDVGRYRRAFPRLFRHPGFKGLGPLGQRLTVYLLFGPQSNRIGLFYFSINTAAEDLDSTAESLRKALADVLSAFGWMFDSTARVFYVPSWWRWNHPDHDKVLRGNMKDLSEIPPCGVLDAFGANLAYLNPELHESFIEAFHLRSGKAPRSQYQESVSESVQEQEPSALRAGIDGKDSREIRTVAVQAVQFCNDNDPLDHVVDVFHQCWNRQHQGKTTPTRAQITAAIQEARAARRRFAS